MARLNTVLAATFIGLSLVGNASFGAVPPLLCLLDPTLRSPALPAALSVGVENIDRDPSRVVTVFLPLDPRATLLNMNAKTFTQRLPNHFISGDGSVTRAFIGVDADPGGMLSACIDELISLVPNVDGPDSPPPAEAVFEFIQMHLADYLATVADTTVLPWNARLQMPSAANQALQHVLPQPIGVPETTTLTLPVVPLEYYLADGQGYCIEKSILASLMLSRLNLAHVIENGATPTGGHTWLRLADGRILDPTWQLLVLPTPAPQTGPNWMTVNGTVLYIDPIYPYLVW